MNGNEIETSRFLLRPIVQDDIHDVFLGLSDPEVIKHYGVSFDSLEATEEQMQWFKSQEDNKTGRWWAICRREDHHFMGAIGFNDLKKEHKCAEIGMWLLRDYWGHGTLKEVMPSVISYGFQEMNIHRIEGYVDSANLKCKSALDKIDFQYEGTMRDCEMKNGKYISIDIYARLATDTLRDQNSKT